VETGYGYFGARYYDSGLSIWLSVDPMSDKYPNMSPYNYCANNPVRFKDPSGLDYYDENANFLGKSVESGVFVVTNTAEINKIRENQDQGKSTEISEVPQAVKLPSKTIRNEAATTVIAEDKANPNREYSGYFGKTASGSDKINWAEPGSEADPCGGEASCNPTNTKNKNDIGTIWYLEGVFHSHPSGTKVINDFSNTNSVFGPSQSRCHFIQKPSEPDLNNAKSSIFPVSYVIALGAADKGGQRVYIYNKDGLKASFPLNAFQNLDD